MSSDRLLTGHRRFKERFESERRAFVGLAQEGQKPQVLWIGCSDSRVIPEQITDAEAGELFVVRNLANVVPPFGVGEVALGAAIEYAVLRLHVAHAIVCGHSQCGGIAALAAPLDLTRESHVARWIEWARPAHTQVEASGLPEEARHLETIKANVLLQRQNLGTYDCVREAVRAGQLTLHAWLYDLYSGDLSVYDDGAAGWSAPPWPVESA
jgi:carbonic anhydrase